LAKCPWYWWFDANWRWWERICEYFTSNRHSRQAKLFYLCWVAVCLTTNARKGDSEQPELIIFIDEAHLILKRLVKLYLSKLKP
jgi:Rad3-related DNA helicase